MAANAERNLEGISNGIRFLTEGEGKRCGWMFGELPSSEKGEMMRTTTRAIMLVVVVLNRWTWAGADPTNQAPGQLRLGIALVDGSRVIGVPDIKSIPIHFARP